MTLRDAFPILALALGSAGLSYMIVDTFPPARAEPPRVYEETIVVREGPSAYDEALDELNRDLVAYERLAARPPLQWLHIERVASLYMQRAQLTGDHGDYVRAQEELERAFSIAGEGSGPLLTRAYLHFTLHRLDRVEPDLAQIERGILIPPGVVEEIKQLRADLAFQRGDYERAAQLHRELEEAHPSSLTAFGIAQDLWRTGQLEQADRFLALAAARAERSPRSASWVELQRGVLDEERGRYDDALAHYRRADELFSGHWLVEERLARIDARQGRLASAERRYRTLIGRVESAELMDPLADILERRGRGEQAERMRASATASYERSLETLPEASYGHALRHFLKHGSAARALELALANHAQRPNGEAATLLAMAHYRAGDRDAARAQIEAVLATPYRSAELHAAAAKIFEGGRAQQQRRLALAFSPDAIEDLAWLTIDR
jgi:tetratricopeptide (TPR) repeat protein